jgi:hypothetical protein
MGTRVVRIPAPPAQERAGVRRLLDPAGTALMLAVSASVLAGSLLIASLSTGAVGERSFPAGIQPAPEPPPTLMGQ